MTVGEETKPIYEGFKYVKEINEVYLIATEKTKTFAEEICRNMKNVYSNIKIVEVSTDSVEDILFKLNQDIKVNLNTHIISNITGGTKIMTLALYIYTSVLNGSVFYILKLDDEKMIKIDVPTLEYNFSIDRSKRKIIETLYQYKDKKITQTQLAKLLKRKESTVKYSLDNLKKNNLVEIEYTKNGKLVSLTSLGKLITIIEKIKSKKSSPFINTTKS